MRFKSNTVQNLKAAEQSNDKTLVREILIDAMADMIEENPKAMIKTLRYSNVKVRDNVSIPKLVSLAAYNLHNNRKFHKNLAVTISLKDKANPSDYSNSEGGGEGEGGGGAAIVGSIADMIGSISQWGAANQNLKKEEQRTKSQMYQKIFGEEQKTNWIPIVAIAGVLLIGSIVVWRVTKK